MRDDTRDELRRELAYQRNHDQIEWLHGRKELCCKFGIADRWLRQILNHPATMTGSGGGYFISAQSRKTGEFFEIPPRAADGTWRGDLEPVTHVNTAAWSIDYSSEIRSQVRSEAATDWPKKMKVNGTVKVR